MSVRQCSRKRREKNTPEATAAVFFVEEVEELTAGADVKEVVTCDDDKVLVS